MCLASSITLVLYKLYFALKSGPSVSGGSVNSVLQGLTLIQLKCTMNTACGTYKLYWLCCSSSRECVGTIIHLNLLTIDRVRILSFVSPSNTVDPSKKGEM